MAAPEVAIVRDATTPRSRSRITVRAATGGGWTRTNDLGIMSHPTGADSKELQQDSSADSSADSGKVLQNPQPRRNKTEHKGKE